MAQTDLKTGFERLSKTPGQELRTACRARNSVLTLVGNTHFWEAVMRTRIAIAAVISTLVVPLTTVEASAAAPVRFSAVQYNSPGPDTRSNASLNAEWAKVTNYSKTTRTLTGWTIRDLQRHVYRFPTFRLRPGGSVRLHTGKGTNTATNLYWRSGNYIWNNTGDRATLKNSAGTTIDICSWGDGPGFTRC